MVFFFLKEGSGLSLEQVQTLWEDKNTPAWRSESWIPPGYAHRRDAIEAEAPEKKGARNFGDAQHIDDSSNDNPTNV